MIRKQKLPNGLTFITESIPHVRSVSIGVWLKRGSRHEPASLNGISHFIEHLVFKGTETRSAREIALAMDSVGGQMDAFTTKEYTCFYAKVLDEHLPETVDLLSDIVLHPKFDPDEVERERKVVLEEIRMVEDTPDELVYDLFAEHFYGGNPLGRPIQGTAKTLAGLSRGRVLRFFKDVYCPDNIVVAAAGNLRHDRLARLVRKAFGGMTPGNGDSRRMRRPRPRPGVVRKSKRDLEQAHVLMGLPAYPEDFRDRYTLFVLNTLLGGTMSSRLFQKIREQHGLAYSVYSAVNGFIDAGFLMIYLATRPDQARGAVGLIQNELRDLREVGPSKAELEVAKEHLKGSLMLSLESTSSRMSNLARQNMYFRRQFTLKEILRGIERVTVGKVHALSGSLFHDCPVALAAVGPLKQFRMSKKGLQL
jgi:predicted Zn-dependent peptidase